MERLFLLLFQSSCDFYLSRGFSELPQVLVNGVILELEEDVRDGTDLETMREREGWRERGGDDITFFIFVVQEIQNAIVTEVQRQTSEIQQLVYRVRDSSPPLLSSPLLSSPLSSPLLSSRLVSSLLLTPSLSLSFRKRSLILLIFMIIS